MKWAFWKRPQGVVKSESDNEFLMAFRCGDYEAWFLECRDGTLLRAKTIEGELAVPIYEHESEAAAFVAESGMDCFPQRVGYAALLEKFGKGYLPLVRGGRFRSVVTTDGKYRLKGMRTLPDKYYDQS